ncbi:MAG: hypothetical protein ABI878_14060 [Acidobacteriota bacterium]
MPDQTQENKNTFYFEAYGVRLRIDSNDSALLDEVKLILQQTFGVNLRITGPLKDPLLFGIDRDGGEFVMYKDGKVFTNGAVKDVFLRFFDSMVRVTIAEHAVDRVFVHAGVVGWKGKAIVIPGNSFSGKTTLVYELVRRGAEYFSDEYAVFDAEGLVHPFPRRLAVRNRPEEGQSIETTYLMAEEIGGRSATTPIPVGHVLFTEFRENAAWEPDSLTPGQAVLEMVSHTAPIRYNTKLSLEILKKVTANAIILRSCRSDAIEFSEFFLEFVDNKAF